MNKNYKSEKLFDLLTNDASIENTDFFALSTRIILHNDLIECYYTNFNNIDNWYITKLIYNSITKKIDLVDYKCGINMIAYNFELINFYLNMPPPTKC